MKRSESKLAHNEPAQGIATNEIISDEKQICFSKGIEMVKDLFICPYCDKQYRFQVSLVSHNKFRHPDKLPKLKRGRPKLSKRGRPRRINVIPHTEDGKANEFELAFISDFNDIVYDLYNTHNKHPLYTKLIEIAQSKAIIKVKTCDDILAEYLMFLRVTQSREQVKTGIKFILLNRPSFCPAPSNEFMPAISKQYLSNEEVMQQTTGLCKWLLDNSYTYILLTLIPVKENN